VVVFAYTLKGWRLPTEGHPANHSALLSLEQMGVLAERLGGDPDDRWAGFAPDSEESRLCAQVRERLQRPALHLEPPVPVPPDLGRRHRGEVSTQQALGRLLGELHRSAPAVADRVVTVSPDVATSTNLGGWINHSGVWALGDRVDWFAGDQETLVRWREGDHGNHIELGIAETNLVGLLGELGLTWARFGRPLIPIGTVYDPFVGRALEPWSFGIYAGGQSILVGTPSGITLAPEGGAHQSVVTPSIGIAQPGCVAWEPAFAQDLEWALLHAMGRLGRPGGESAYFRLSTRPVDQSLAGVPEDDAARAARRDGVLAGGYRLHDPGPDGREPRITLVGVGAVMAEVVEAGRALTDFGIPAEVLCLTSPDLVFRALQARRGLSDGQEQLHDLLPPRSSVPIVTVIDGHPSALAFLAGSRPAPTACLGVTGFGQSGDLGDLYRHHGLDVDTIVGSAVDLVR
jgi:pyruvate dehydrogenase E1 component